MTSGEKSGKFQNNAPNALLQESEAKQNTLFKKLTQNSFDIINLLAADGAILFESGATQRILGYEPGKRLGQKAFDFVHPDDLPMIIKEFGRLTSGEENIKVVEYRILHDNGSFVWLESSGQNFLHDPDVNGIITNSRNITHRKKMESQRFRQSKLYHTLNDYLFDMVSITDLKGNIEFSSRSHDVLGYDPHHLFGKSIFDFVHPEDKATFKARFSKFLLDLESTVLDKTIFRVVSKDGSKTWVETVVSKIQDENGKVVNLILNSRNITEKVEKDHVLNRKYEIERCITKISTAFTDIDSTNYNKKILMLLEDTCKVFEADRAYLFLFDSKGDSASNSHEWCAPGISSELKRLQAYPLDRLPWWTKQIMSKSVIRIGSIDRLPKEAKAEKEEFLRQKIKSLVCVPILINHEVIGFFGYDRIQAAKHWPVYFLNYFEILANVLSNTINKLENLKKLEESESQLRKINAQKDKFFSILAHDLKNPFQTILGFAGMLSNEIDDFNKEDIKCFADMVYSATKNTYVLLEELLEWAQIQQGKVEYHFEQLNLDTLLGDCLGTCIMAAEKKQITIHTDFDAQLNLVGDRFKLQTIIRNLVGNAVKFTPNKGQVWIKAIQTPLETCIEISDSGIGMDSEELSLIFQIDKKNNKEGTDGEKGTGFGLILCKELIEMHNGRMEVKSTLHHGSTFTVIIPIKFQ